MGRHPRAEHAAPEMVAVAVLRHDPLGGGLLDRVSVLAARVLLHQGRVRLAVARRGGFGPRRAQGAARPDGRKARVGIAAGDRVGSDTRSILRARRLARLSRRIARLATVRAAAAGEAIRTSTMMNGSGAASSTRSRRPSATASAPEMPKHGRARPCRLSAATASSSAPMIENVGDFVRSLAGLAADPKADLAAGKKIFADNCAVCHGETGKGKRELGAPNLSDAIWLYGADKAVDRRRHLERSRRRDARLGGPARRRHDQGARGLRAFARRRREMSHVARSVTSRWLCMTRTRHNRRCSSL